MSLRSLQTGSPSPGGFLSPIRKLTPFRPSPDFLNCASDITLRWNPPLDLHRYASPVPTRVVRKIPNDGPVTDASNPDIACNKGGETGTNKTMTINAGSDVTFQWTNVRTSAPMHYPWFDLLSRYWLVIVAYGPQGPRPDSNGSLQRGLFRLSGCRWSMV